MMYCITAYDYAGKQILGNTHGQAIFKASNYKLTNHYKKLVKELRDSSIVAMYRITKAISVYSVDWDEVETIKA